MAARGVRVLMMTAVSVSVVSAVWRYSNNMGSRISINTRSTLHLEYEGDSFFQWIVPKPCTVSFPTSRSVTLSCHLRGVHRIYPRVFNQTIEDAPRTFNIEAALFNFIWYMVKMPESLTSDDEEDLVDGYLNTAQKDILRIWILDPEKASSTELNNKAEFPSLLSSALTKEFFNLGQDLQLKWYPIEHRYKTQFNSEHGYWTVIIYNVTTEIILTISGKPLTFQNLFVMDTSYTIEKRLDLSVIKALGYLSLKMAYGSDPLIVYHQCSSSSALLLTDFGTFISHDGFITVEELKIVPTEQQHIEQNKVKTAAFLGTNILFLLGNALYIRYAKGFNNKLGTEHSLPEEGIIGLMSRMSCATGYPVKVRIPDWSSVITTIKPDSIKICTVSYGSRPPDVGVLMEATDINDKRRLFLTIYNEETKTWFNPLPNSSSKHYHKLNILIKMNNNLMLFGVVGTNALVKLHVGCLREAQTWESMLSRSGSYKHISDAWGPENYRSCYETPGLIRNMHRPYEILNSSNSVFITWPTDHTGIYLFTVKVLDSNYSFCKLTAHFAVETYGVVVSLSWQHRPGIGRPQGRTMEAPSNKMHMENVGKPLASEHQELELNHRKRNKV
ncbi:cation channel sperm-associated auxiliary subunit epsilon-like [Mobula birostris]|uniref:cation channel sperm-associated auxiliary subunit epsilon-like n=1 Tax=Mobula birostris TaxID=1983395 RepID=UPI003B27D9B9